MEGVTLERLPPPEGEPPPPLPGVEHVWLDAGELRTHLALAGPEQGPALLLVHGWPQHWLMWRELIGPLAEAGYRVICPDLRGFGWTEAPGSGYDQPTFARDLAALLDALGLEGVRLIGHDWGGYAAFLLACARPELVERMVVLCVPPPWSRAGARGLLEGWRLSYQLLVSAPGLSGFLLRRIGRPGRLRRLIAGRARWGGGAGDSYAERFRDPSRVRASESLYRYSMTREQPRILRGHYRGLRLRVPTLLLGASHDAVVRPVFLRGADSQADELETSELAGGHFIVEEHPEPVLERALGFLGRP